MKAICKECGAVQYWYAGRGQKLRNYRCGACGGELASFRANSPYLHADSFEHADLDATIGEGPDSKRVCKKFANIREVEKAFYGSWRIGYLIAAYGCKVCSLDQCEFRSEEFVRRVGHVSSRTDQ